MKGCQVSSRTVYSLANRVWVGRMNLVQLFVLFACKTVYGASEGWLSGRWEEKSGESCNGIREQDDFNLRGGGLHQEHMCTHSYIIRTTLTLHYL